MRRLLRGVSTVFSEMSHLPIGKAFVHDLGKNVRVYSFRVLSDNFSYLIANEEDCWAVDPANPEAIAKIVQEHGLALRGAFVTHKHFDHAGGNERFLQLFAGAHVYGNDDIPFRTHTLTDNSICSLGDGVTLKALHTPCHTPKHMCFYVEGGGRPAVFTGDTLFISGCGRFNEGGTAEDMMKALDKIAAMPLTTHVFVGHEYTLTNALFTAGLLENNKDAQYLVKFAKECRSKGVPTVPRTLEEELKCNPFMRLHDPELHIVLKTVDPVEIMRRLRTMKNDYKVPANEEIASLRWNESVFK